MKRKDAASVLVAIVLAMILMALLSQLTMNWAGELSGLKDGQYGYPGTGWRTAYLYPSVSAALQLVLLEVFVYVYTAFQDVFKKK